MDASSHEVTALLRAWSDGDLGARDRLVPLVYQELRRRAAHHLRRERREQTLQPTALVHEAFLKLVGSGDPGWEGTGHFFGAGHTQSRYTTAFYAPFLSDWRNYEAWEEAGSPTTEQRANRIWKAILAEFEPPPMDDAIRDELAAFVARRKREGGAPTDY